MRIVCITKLLALVSAPVPARAFARTSGLCHHHSRAKNALLNLSPIHTARQLRPGLMLRCSFSAQGHAHRADAHSHSQAGSGLHLVLALQGQFQLSYAGQTQRLGGADEAQLALVALHRPEPFERVPAGAGPECKLSLELSPEWLEQAGLGPARRHLQASVSRAPKLLRQLGLGLIRQADSARGLAQLRLECQTLELLAEGLNLAGQPVPASTRSKMQQALELLDSGAADAWTLADIALELGLHENTLQRQFRAQHGRSVFEHLRQARLQRGRAALLQGAPVTAAALEAGYENPANFATAFKRQFGHSPGRLLARP